MTKQELLTDLAVRPFIKAVGTPVIAHVEIKFNNGKWYEVSVLEITSDSKVGIYRNIHFYVVDEGTAKEQAFYKDQEPSKSVKSLAEIVAEKVTTPITPIA